MMPPEEPGGSAKPKFTLRPRTSKQAPLTVVTMFGESAESTALAMANQLPSPKQAPPSVPSNQGDDSLQYSSLEEEDSILSSSSSSRSAPPPPQPTKEQPPSMLQAGGGGALKRPLAVDTREYSSTTAAERPSPPRKRDFPTTAPAPPPSSSSPPHPVVSSIMDVRRRLIDDAGEEEEDEDDLLFKDVVGEEEITMHQLSLVSPRESDLAARGFHYPATRTSSSLDSNDDDDEEEEDDDISATAPPPPPPPLLADDDDYDDDEDGTGSQFDFAAFGEELLRRAQHRTPPPPPPRRARSLAQKKDFDMCFYVADGRAREEGGNWPVLVFDCQQARRVLFKYNLETEAEDALLEYCAKLLTRTADGGGEGGGSGSGKFAVAILAGLSFTELLRGRDLFVRLVGACASLQQVRKQVQRVWIVHPVALCQSFLFAIRQVVSRKFWRKLYFFPHLRDLNDLVLIPLTQPRQAQPVEAEAEGEEEEEGTLAAHSSVRNFYNHWQCALSLGAPLAQLAAKSPFGIPSLVHRTITFLLFHGMTTPGLFRIGEDQDVVAQCKTDLQAGKDVHLGGYWSSSSSDKDVREVSPESVHVCAYLLKSFFRDLPEALIPASAYGRIVQLAKESEGDTDLLAYVLSKALPKILPPSNYAVLRYLVYFLHHCAKQDSRGTLMNAQNLAKIWNVNLFRFDANPQVEMMNLPHTIGVTLVFIQHTAVVFPLCAEAVLPVCFSPLTGRELAQDELVWDGHERETDTMLLMSGATAAAAAVAAAHAAADEEAAKTTRAAILQQYGGCDVDGLSNRELKRLLQRAGVHQMPLERAECVIEAKGVLSRLRGAATPVVSTQQKTKSTRLPRSLFVSRTETGAVEQFLSTSNASELAQDSSRLRLTALTAAATGGGATDSHRPPARSTRTLQAAEWPPLFGEKTPGRSVLLLPKSSSSSSATPFTQVTCTLQDVDRLSRAQLVRIAKQQHGHRTSLNKHEEEDEALRRRVRRGLVTSLLSGGPSVQHYFFSSSSTSSHQQQQT